MMSKVQHVRVIRYLTFPWLQSVTVETDWKILLGRAKIAQIRDLILDVKPHCPNMEICSLSHSLCEIVFKVTLPIFLL